MTVSALKIKEKATDMLRRPDRICLALLSVFSLLLILRNSEIAIARVTTGLELCAGTVIPSLFPFMVVSELIVGGNAVRLVAPIFAKPCKRLFGISEEGCAAVILGMLCGSPIGAKCASSLYRQGKIELKEYSHIINFSNAPSSAFLISAVGTAMFESKSFGVALYCISLISAVIIGIWGGRRIKKAPQAVRLGTGREPSSQTRPRDGISLFTGAVTSSALSMLNVCAFVVFFSTLVGTLEAVLSGLSLPPWLNALFFGLFEMTSGISKASRVPLLGGYIAAFLAGWSGLSIHFQIMSVCGGDGLSFRPYLGAKLLHGLLNLSQLLLIHFIFGFTP